MSTIVKLNETTILQNMSLQCKSNALDVSPEEAEWYIKVLFAGVTDFLNIAKSKARPICVQICDLKGNMVSAAVIQYIPAEDNEEVAEGSWNYFWTFNKEDLPEDVEAFQITSGQVVEVISRTGYDMVRMVFKAPTFISQMAVYMCNIIIDVLDQNAPTVEGEEWAVELDGFFKASVSIEDGHQVKAIEPMGELVVKIKNDATSEK